MRRARSKSRRISSRERSVTARKSRLAMDSWEASQNDSLRLLILPVLRGRDKRRVGVGANDLRLHSKDIAPQILVVDDLREPVAHLWRVEHQLLVGQLGQVEQHVLE